MCVRIVKFALHNCLESASGNKRLSNCTYGAQKSGHDFAQMGRPRLAPAPAAPPRQIVVLDAPLMAPSAPFAIRRGAAIEAAPAQQVRSWSPRLFTQSLTARLLLHVTGSSATSPHISAPLLPHYGLIHT